MVSIVSGKTAIEIVNTLIRNKYISSHQHAADMGIELCKAELALKYNLKYVQDKDLKIKWKNSIMKNKIYIIDVNTNTNYNSVAERDSELKGMKSIAEFLKKELLFVSNIKVVA